MQEVVGYFPAQHKQDHPNYSYLADGTKISALDGGGEGLVYRGPFVYRRSTGSGTSSLTLESVAFGGARQYSPALRRWMAPDPLSEKYYGISPYTFCNNNPLRYVDPDGRDDIYINFPDYVISVGNMQFENLGH